MLNPPTTGADSRVAFMPEGSGLAALESPELAELQLGQPLGQFKAEGSWPSALHVLEPDAAGDPEGATVEIRRRVRDWQQGGGHAGA